MLVVTSSWGECIPKLIPWLALKPNNDALIDIQKHCRCTDEIQDPAPGFVGSPLNMEQDIKDCKFPKSSGEDGADVENPIVQKAKPKMSGINLGQVISDAVTSG